MSLPRRCGCARASDQDDGQRGGRGEGGGMAVYRISAWILAFLSVFWGLMRATTVCVDAKLDGDRWSLVVYSRRTGTAVVDEGVLRRVEGGR